MISINKIGSKMNDRVLELVGLSTDEKPIAKVDDIRIVNGSTFFEMDTGDVSMYDEENQRWLLL